MTKQQTDALPCPFCGKEPTLTKHHKEDAWGLTHRCEVIGPFSFSWGSRELHIERWNRRTPAYQAQRTPLSDEQIAEACGWKAELGCKPLPRELRIARAIEESHGITQEKQG